MIRINIPMIAQPEAYVGCVDTFDDWQTTKLFR